MFRRTRVSLFVARSETPQVGSGSAGGRTREEEDLENVRHRPASATVLGATVE